MTQATATISMTDFSQESSTLSVAIGDYTVGDTGGAAYDDAQAKLTELINAIDGVSKGIIKTSAVTFKSAPNFTPAPADAHRELKLLIGGRDAVNGRAFTITVPMPDETALQNVAGTDFYVLSGTTAGTALKTALTNHVKSVSGNAIIVDDRARIVGRNI